MPRERSRYRERRSSSSSDSSYDRKMSKSKHKRRSHSRDRSESKSRKSKSSKHKRRSYSRSLSREKYESSKSRRRSSSKSRSKTSKHSRDRSRSRSSSRSYSKRSKSSKKHRRRSSSSDSRSNSFDIEPRNAHLDDTESKVEKAIKAAAAAGLTMTKIPTYEYNDVEIKEDMPTIHDRNLLDELNSDTFVQKSFTSSKSKKQSQNIVIDLNAETVKVPEAEAKNKTEDSIIDFDEIPSQEELKEMWVKKLYQYRKKMLKEDL
ncbi:serine/arginine-rich splicing factor 4 [Aricia agestis]|uniref:serine/arginine-rich splicing factor 4 n=1 Tax=Aricia agestis TaxID=91739 RepID=UPI001C20397F|nr:serine/arginine-rich splicing factor 4 [Aricia agestis]